MNTTRYLANAAAGITLALLAGCGGGGGGGGGVSAVVYSGNTSPAAIMATNASTITANVVGGTDAGTIIGGVSVVGGSAAPNQGTGPAHLGRLLHPELRDVVVRISRADNSQQLLSAAVVTEGCDSGSIQVSGSPTPGGTGTFSLTFLSCTFAGVTANGPATLRIDAFDLVNLIPTDFTLIFARLTLRGAVNIDAGGSIRFQEMGNTSMLTMNLDEVNNNTGKMSKTVNLVVESVIVSPTSFNEWVTGQVYHSDFGYVDVTTVTPLFFSTLDQVFPDSGQIVLTGAPVNMGNRAIRVTALTSPPAAMPATMVRLELNLDGDGTYEVDARMLWTQLDGPVGSDLGDTDGDGMHNSWETFHGAPLNPLVIDAGGDADNDGITNFDEYLAGTDPTP